MAGSKSGVTQPDQEFTSMQATEGDKPSTAVELLSFWRLSERPFEATWDTRFFFRTEEQDEAFHRLNFLVAEESMQMGMVTGEIGCGKTLLRALFADQLDSTRFEPVVLENSGFSFEDLLGAMLRSLGVEFDRTDRSKLNRFLLFREKVEEVYDDDRHLVVLFDEAQEMDRATLNEIKQLTNLNGDAENYLTVILFGQPELRRRVLRVPAIDQRISLRFHLPPLNSEDTAEYLRHRLLVAGHPTGNLFAEDAVELAFQASGGIPRELNRIAKLSLEVGWLKELPVISRSIVSAVITDLQRHQKFVPHERGV